jgi:hypothetical protein
LPPRLHLLLTRGGKSPAAHASGVGAPDPCAGGGEVSPGDSAVQSLCDTVDTPQGERAGKGSPTVKPKFYIREKRERRKKNYIRKINI